MSQSPSDIVIDIAARDRAVAHDKLARAERVFAAQVENDGSKALLAAVQQLALRDPQSPSTAAVTNSIGRTDWHLLAQLLTEGPAFLYLTPQGLNEIEESSACHISLLVHLARRRLVYPLLQTRARESWLGWTPPSDGHLELLRLSIAPAEAVGALLERISPGFEARQARAAAWISHTLGSIAEVSSRDQAGDTPEAQLRASSYRLELLRTIRYREVGLLEWRLRESGWPGFDRALMLAYRLNCAPAVTCFGGMFVLPPWVQREIEQILPRNRMMAGASRAHLRLNAAADLYRQALIGKLPELDALDWRKFRDPTCAREACQIVDSLIELGYWDALANMRAQLQATQAECSGFDADGIRSMDVSALRREVTRLREIRERACNDMRAIAISFAHHPSVAPAPFVLDESIALSEAGPIMQHVNPDLPQDERRIFETWSLNEQAFRCLVRFAQVESPK